MTDVKMVSVNFLGWFGLSMLKRKALLFQDIVIQQDDEIRLKIVGTRVDKNDIVSCVFLKYLSNRSTFGGMLYKRLNTNSFPCFSVCHWVSDGWLSGWVLHILCDKSDSWLYLCNAGVFLCFTLSYILSLITFSVLLGLVSWYNCGNILYGDLFIYFLPCFSKYISTLISYVNMWKSAIKSKQRLDKNKSVQSSNYALTCQPCFYFVCDL